MLKFHTILDEVALETESLVRDMRAAWYSLQIDQRISLSCAVIMLLSTFLPWISLPFFPTDIGITGGGVFHIHLAFITLQQRNSEKRNALMRILIGAACTLVSIGVLSYYAWLHTTFNPASHVRYGFYIATVSGIGISVGGLLRFFRSCPK